MLTLEAIMCSTAGFALAASPAQRALYRVADGRPLGDLADHPHVVEALGGAAAVAALPGVQPAEVTHPAPIRCGKSMLAAGAGIVGSQRINVSGLGPGEVPRVSIVSLSMDLAGAVLQHLQGVIQARPALRALLVGEPTADGVTLRHPSGRPVEIRVVAGSRAGASLVSRWSAGVIFDEAPRMVGADDGVVNLDHALSAVRGRILPGAWIWKIGSPWAPFGPVYQEVTEHWGKPSADLVVYRGTGPQLNPTWWTPKRCADLERRDPIAYRTDVLGEFADPESGLFAAADLDRITRTSPRELPHLPGRVTVAAMDPGTRGNAWTFVIMTRIPRTPHPVAAVALARQWIGSKSAPLSPDAVLAEIAAECRRYGVRVVSSDQFAADALADIARRHGITLATRAVTSTSKLEMFESLRTRVAEGEVELPPDRQVRADLLSVKKRITQTGMTIELPRTADGRHADYAPALALALAVLPSRAGLRLVSDAAGPTHGDQMTERERTLFARDDQSDRSSALAGWASAYRST